MHRVRLLVLLATVVHGRRTRSNTWLNENGVRGDLRSNGSRTPTPARGHAEMVPGAHGARDNFELPQRPRAVAEDNSTCKLWHMMHVPKTGGTLMNDFIIKSSRHIKSRNRTYCDGRIQVHDHTQLYMPCSFVTLREPCSRAVSSYAHLRHVYPTRGPGTAKTVNEYVIALQAHWSEILNRKITTWPAKDRHLVLAMPQHLWIGKASKVLCTDRLDELLPATLRGMGCRAVPNSTALVKGVGGAANKYTQMSGRLTAEQANLSTASCTAVRKLYWQDWFLYQQQCLGS